MAIILLILTILLLALIALILQQRWPRSRRLARGLLVSYMTIVIMLGGAEVYFRFVFAESENVITLGAKNWLARYWHINSLGFRDREWSLEALEGKRTVLMVGDSFTAGWGIENPEDRFSNVLAHLLGDDYAVLNLGVYGTATVEQLDLLKSHPVRKPNVVILQYFLNDINYSGLRLGLLPEPEPTPALALQSYLANYIYWRIIKNNISTAEGYQDWWQWSYAAYDNATIWDLHREEIENFIDYVDSIGAELIVVIFPNLTDPVRSIPYVDRVATVFVERGHPDILKLYDDVAAWNRDDLMVSARDSHPSVSFHRHVGERLYEMFFKARRST